MTVGLESWTAVYFILQFPLIVCFQIYLYFADFREPPTQADLFQSDFYYYIIIIRLHHRIGIGYAGPSTSQHLMYKERLTWLPVQTYQQSNLYLSTRETDATKSTGQGSTHVLVLPLGKQNEYCSYCASHHHMKSRTYWHLFFFPILERFLISPTWLLALQSPLSPGNILYFIIIVLWSARKI